MEMKEQLEILNGKVAQAPESPEVYMERGVYYYSCSDFGNAINDFNKVLQYDADNTAAKEYLNMIQEILAFRYTDLYNP